MMFSSMVLSSAATVSSWHTNNFPQSSTSTPEIVSKYLSMAARFSTGADLLVCQMQVQQQGPRWRQR